MHSKTLSLGCVLTSTVLCSRLDELEPPDCMCTHTFNATEQGVVIRVGFEPTVVPRWTDPLEVFSLTVTDILGLSVESSLAADCSTGICAYVPHRVAQLYRGEAVEVTWRITNSSVATPYAFARWLAVNSSEPTVGTGYPYPEHVCDAGAMAGTCTTSLGRNPP